MSAASRSGLAALAALVVALSPCVHGAVFSGSAISYAASKGETQDLLYDSSRQLLYTADGAGGLQVINVLYPSSPSVAGEKTTYPLRGVAGSGQLSHVYGIGTSDSLVEYDTAFLSSPSIIGTSALDNRVRNCARMVRVRDASYVYACCHEYGLVAFDVSSTTPTITSVISTDTECKAVVEDSYRMLLYVLTGEPWGGVTVYDYGAQPSRPVKMGSVTTPGNAYYAYSDAHVLYVADGKYFVSVNVTTPRSPEILDAMSLLGPSQMTGMVGVSCCGSTCFGVAFEGWVDALDCTDPANVASIDRVALRGRGKEGCACSTTHVFAAASTDGVAIIPYTGPYADTSSSIAKCRLDTRSLTAATGSVSYPYNGGTYLSQQKICWHIACSADLVLSFPRFETEEGYDYVTVHAFQNTVAVEVAVHSGVTVPVSETISGNVLVLFESDADIVNNGFTMEWTCGTAAPTSAPPTNVPDTDVPETPAPPTNPPDTAVPDTNAPDTNAPDTKVPDTEVPDTTAPDTEVPPTDVPDTPAPATEQPTLQPTLQPTQLTPQPTEVTPTLLPQQTTQAPLTREELDKAEGDKKQEEAAEELDQAAGGAVIAGVVGAGAAGAATQLVVVSGWCRTSDHHDRLPVTLNPTGLVIGGQPAAGMIVGNVAITLGFLVLCSIVLCVVKSIGPSNVAAKVEESMDAQGVLRFPSAPLFVFQLTFQGTTLGGMILVLSPPDTWAFALGACTVLASMLVPLFVFARVARDIPKRAVYLRDAEVTPPMRLLIGQGEWVNREKNADWVHRYSSVVRTYRQPMAWYALIEFAGSFTLAAIHAVKTESLAACGHAKVASAVVFLILLVLEATLWPHARFRDSFADFVALGAQFSAMLAMAYGYYRGENGNAWTFSVANHMLAGAVAIIFTKALLDVITEVYILFSGRRRRLQALYYSYADGDEECHHAAGETSCVDESSSQHSVLRLSSRRLHSGEHPLSASASQRHGPPCPLEMVDSVPGSYTRLSPLVPPQEPAAAAAVRESTTSTVPLTVDAPVPPAASRVNDKSDLQRASTEETQRLQQMRRSSRAQSAIYSFDATVRQDSVPLLPAGDCPSSSDPSPNLNAAANPQGRRRTHTVAAPSFASASSLASQQQPVDMGRQLSTYSSASAAAPLLSPPSRPPDGRDSASSLLSPSRNSLLLRGNPRSPPGSPALLAPAGGEQLNRRRSNTASALLVAASSLAQSPSSGSILLPSPPGSSVLPVTAASSASARERSRTLFMADPLPAGTGGAVTSPLQPLAPARERKRSIVGTLDHSFVSQGGNPDLNSVAL
eukprot:Rhum_TRINITY_DN14333_c3_g1::Rhum_TRINITY_DN14333_c3_g1_i1::g.81316::m.81316